MFSRKRRDTSSVNISGYSARPMIYRPPYGSKGFGGLGGSNGRYVPSVATSPYEQIYNQYSYGQGARPFGPVPLHASQSSASYGPASYGPASYGPPSYGPASYGTVSNAPITYAPSPYVPTYEPAYDPAPYGGNSGYGHDGGDYLSGYTKGLLILKAFGGLGKDLATGRDLATSSYLPSVATSHV